jgi:hypothetical protein
MRLTFEQDEKRSNGAKILWDLEEKLQSRAYKLSSLSKEVWVNLAQTW